MSDSKNELRPKENTIIVVGDRSLRDKFIVVRGNVKVEFVEA